MAPSHQQKLSSLILLAMLLSSFHVNFTSTTPMEEVQALLKWKDGLHASGAHSFLSSWIPTPRDGRSHANSSSHCGNWHGISCNKVGRIIEVNLSAIGIVGSLDIFPFSFLPYLTHLDLSANNLSGTIPVHLANLTRLNYLDLSSNHLFGEIPVDIGNLFRLSTLDLSLNLFTGSIPSSFGNLRSLNALYLVHNHLSGRIPSSLCGLKNLTELGINENQLSGPIPQEIGNLTSLIVLAVYQNHLTGSIPASLGNLTTLEFLNLYQNYLSDFIPSELGNMKSLVQLDLSENNLSGSIPLSLSYLHNLNTLQIFSNQLSGSIPQEIRNLTSLTAILVYRNKLTGPIPTSLGTLAAVRLLFLSENDLSGTIPSEIGKMISLVDLDLSSNHLDGPVPSTFGNLKHLKYLALRQNNLTGRVPKSLKNCESLTRVRLDSNKLTGNISEAFGIYPSLYYINLGYNQLYGELSNSWSRCTNLTNFLIPGNNITGRIPHGFGKLARLGNLDLSSNSLIGEVPKELGSLTSLLILNLSHNYLSGNLPKDIGSLSGLEMVDLSSNNLSGPLTKDIARCSKLRYSDLSRNKFSGSIPSELGNMASLNELLDLSRNLFGEEIPSELGKLKYLEKLNLSHNLLSGSIPPSFEQMISLTSIDVSYNSLEGPVPAFREDTEQAFSPNKGLCGRAKALQHCALPKVNNGGSKGLHRTAIIVSSCVVFMMSLAFAVTVICFVLYKKKTEKNEESGEVRNGDRFNMWSFDGRMVYKDIIEATEGFNDKHCIGMGEHGSVYKSVLSTGQVVAVKKFHQSQDGETVNLKSFETELHALTEMRHRNIVKLYGFCSDVRHSFLVYKYLERGSLATILNNVKDAAGLDWKKRINIIKDVANALSYMHHNCTPPLIHRDISSKNILLNKDYNACVADFGIARVLQQNSSNWTAPAGTYGYLAPELAYTMRLTDKSDVFSFGVLTLEVIMGSHPGEFISSVTTFPSQSVTITQVIEMLDKRILPPISAEVIDEVVRCVKLAFSCLNARPESRPTMEFVSNELLHRTISSSELLHTVTVGH